MTSKLDNKLSYPSHTNEETKMPNFNVKVFDIFSHNIIVDAIDSDDARKKVSNILANDNIKPDLSYEYTTNPDLWKVYSNEESGENGFMDRMDEFLITVLNEDGGILIDEFLTTLLNDDEGVSIKVYNSLCELAAKTGNLDIINKVRIQDGRCYIKGDSNEV